jgi:hypothetical protein
LLSICNELIDPTYGSSGHSKEANRITAKLLIKPLIILVNSGMIMKTKETEKMSKLLEIFFSTISELRQYGMGLDFVERALSFLPRKHHPMLWQYKIIYLSGSGASNLTPAAFTVKQDDPLLQSTVFHLLAQSAALHGDQKQWYQKAIRTLPVATYPIEKAELLLEYFGWLFSNDATEDPESIRGVLEEAISILLNPEEPKQRPRSRGTSDKASLRSKGRLLSQLKMKTEQELEEEKEQQRKYFSPRNQFNCFVLLLKAFYSYSIFETKQKSQSYLLLAQYYSIQLWSFLYTLYTAPKYVKEAALRATEPNAFKQAEEKRLHSAKEKIISTISLIQTENPTFAENYEKETNQQAAPLLLLLFLPSATPGGARQALSPRRRLCLRTATSQRLCLRTNNIIVTRWRRSNKKRRK